MEPSVSRRSFSQQTALDTPLCGQDGSTGCLSCGGKHPPYPANVSTILKAESSIIRLRLIGQVRHAYKRVLIVAYPVSLPSVKTPRLSWSFLHTLLFLKSPEACIAVTIMGAAGGWVSKDAFATTPKEVLRFRIWLTALWASCCGGLHGANTANISGIMSMVPFKKDFGLDDMTTAQVTNWSGWAVSSMLLVSKNVPLRSSDLTNSA